jgi:2-oxoglutarate dehydrogenase complex dehydrogenase (E1) component-like enzyme
MSFPARAGKDMTIYSPSQASMLADLYHRFNEDPGSLDEQWRGFFADLDDEAKAVIEKLNGGASGAAAAVGEVRAGARASVDDPAVRAATLDSIRALMLIRAYRVRGHLEAKLDPLGLKPIEPHPELDPLSYGFTEADMDRPIFIDNVLGLETASLRKIVEVVRATYCGSIGVEFMHIQDPAQKAWIQERIESIRNQPDFTVNGKRVNIPSYLVKDGDVIQVKQKSRELPLVLQGVESVERDTPDYIEVDHNQMKATFIREPKLADVPYPVAMEPHLVIEFYSR